MKKYLRIKSAGLIDVLAFSLIGASTKSGDTTKIGHWGSGNKYAVASLIRNNIKFRVFSGKEEIIFTTAPVTMRDKPFDVIWVNGKETSLTTAMGGEDWDTPFAPIREIYSNALDEDPQATLADVDIMTPKEGFTTIYIEGTAGVKDFYLHLGNYFCNTRKDALGKNYYGTIFPATGTDIRLFRKGILCKEDNHQTPLFYYDSDGFEINESRVIKNEWSAKWAVGRIWGNCDNPDLINKLLIGLAGTKDKYFESQLDWDFVSFSDEWLTACKGKHFVPIEASGLYDEREKKDAYILSMNFLRSLKKAHPAIHIVGMDSFDDIPYAPIVQVEDNVRRVAEEAMSLLKSTPYTQRLGKSEIKFVNFLDSHTLAQAKDGEILLSVKLDTKTPQEVAKIIIEEQEHLITGYNDKTREFQDHLFDLYWTQLEENRKLKEKIKGMLSVVDSL